MAAKRQPPAASTSESERLARVVDMVNQAVDLLNRAIDEVKGKGDDRDAAGAPERSPEQPG